MIKEPTIKLQLNNYCIEKEKEENVTCVKFSREFHFFIHTNTFTAES